MGIEKNVLVTTLDWAINWSRKNSLFPVTFGLACCALEMMVASSAEYDIARFGAEVFRPSPRQSDLMMWPNADEEDGPVVRRSYERCRIPSGSSRTGLRVVGRHLQILQCRTGCGPDNPRGRVHPRMSSRPEALLKGIIELQKKIQKESIKDRPLISLPGKSHER